MAVKVVQYAQGEEHDYETFATLQQAVERLKQERPDLWTGPALLPCIGIRDKDNQLISSDKWK